MPKDDDLAERITGRLSSLVYDVLLPPFFATCGLNTNIGSLDTGLDWAYVLAIIAIAFFGKTLAGFVAAWLCCMPVRESWTVGILMSCKGIVELIALNIGLEVSSLGQNPSQDMMLAVLTHRRRGL